MIKRRSVLFLSNLEYKGFWYDVKKNNAHTWHLTVSVGEVILLFYPIQSTKDFGMMQRRTAHTYMTSHLSVGEAILLILFQGIIFFYTCIQHIIFVRLHLLPSYYRNLGELVKLRYLCFLIYLYYCYPFFVLGSVMSWHPFIYCVQYFLFLKYFELCQALIHVYL